MIKQKIEDLLPRQGNEEEVKGGKRIKDFNSQKILSRLPILLAQIKAGNNSNKLKKEIRQVLHLLYQDKKITKNFYIKLIKSL